MVNLFIRQSPPTQDLLVRRLSRVRIAVVVALVGFGLSGIGTLATENSDHALGDNPAVITPDERDRATLDLEYREQNWDAFARNPAVFASSRQQQVDDIEFYEQNWHFGSGNAFEPSAATVAAPDASQDDIELREGNWRFNRGKVSDHQSSVTAEPKISRNDIEFNEQNWNLKTGDALDNGTLAASGQNEATSSVPTLGIYRVGPRLR